MNIVNVIPLERNVWKNSLTYFSAKDIVPGNIVSVPLRGKTIAGLVTDIRNVADAKTSIRASRIEMRKVSQVLHKKLISNEMLEAASRTSRFYVTPKGIVLAALIPKNLLKKIPHVSSQTSEPTHQQGTYILQTEDEDRFTEYRSLVRESFRHGESVLCLVPTIQDAEMLSARLSKGISEYTLVLHSDRPQRQILKSLENLFKLSHPLLVIATPGFLGLVLDHVHTVIIERENAPAYKQMVKPFIDFRFFVRSFTSLANKRLILGDTLLSSETIYRFGVHQYEELMPPKKHFPTMAQMICIDMRIYKPNLRGKTRSISDELMELLSNIRTASDRIFIFAARKGLSPITICGDCGSLLLCERCLHPVALHKISGDRRLYLCHRCEKTMDPTRRCKTCTSWKLVTLGIGTELIEEELLSAFPDLTILRLDKDTAKTRHQALAIADAFYEKPRSVLIGTELAIPYLYKPVNAIAVASVDELFSIPDFRINERAAYLLLKLKSLTNHEMLIQTRSVEHEVIRSMLNGTVGSLIQSELAMRKSLGYPPFSIPIKITLYGKPDELLEEMRSIAKKLLPYTLDIFPLLEKRSKGKTSLGGVVKIPESAWPNDEVLDVLTNLPLSSEVNVDPVSFA